MSDELLTNEVRSLNKEISGLNGKLDNVQVQVSKMTSALETLARVEERQSSHKEGMNRMGNQIEKQSNHIEKLYEKINQLETQAGLNSSFSRSVERFFWIAVAAIVSIFTYKLK